VLPLSLLAATAASFCVQCFYSSPAWALLQSESRSFPETSSSIHNAVQYRGTCRRGQSHARLVPRLLVPVIGGPRMGGLLGPVRDGEDSEAQRHPGGDRGRYWFGAVGVRPRGGRPLKAAPRPASRSAPVGRSAPRDRFIMDGREPRRATSRGRKLFELSSAEGRELLGRGARRPAIGGRPCDAPIARGASGGRRGSSSFEWKPDRAQSPSRIATLPPRRSCGRAFFGRGPILSEVASSTCILRSHPSRGAGSCAGRRSAGGHGPASSRIERLLIRKTTS